MRMKVCKRIGALVLALALILSGLPQMAIEALADDATGNAFSITGLYSEAERLESVKYWYVNLEHDGGFNIGDTDDFYSTELVSWPATIDYHDGKGPQNVNFTLYDSGKTSIRFQVYGGATAVGCIPVDGSANCTFV